MADEYGYKQSRTSGLGTFLIRLLVGAVVLGITAALTPGFRIAGLWTLLLGALVLAGLDYLASSLLGADVSPFGRGLAGFILAAVILYVTQFIVPGYSVTLLGAVIGALIYGIVDAVIPGRGM